jgi:hypothetical protein
MAGRLGVCVATPLPCHHDAPANAGNAAIAISVENQTANFELEFCKRGTLSTALAKIAMSVPSSRQSTMRSADIWAIALGSNVIVTGSLAPFEQPAQAIQFVPVDAGFFESVQH